jgi:uncharacterized protein YndB with AHSA1/START domain
MTATANQTLDQPVRRTITVKASPELAFRVFTSDIDSWWPRTHHIGKSALKRVVVEEHAGGRCYSEQEDGTDSDWGRVLVWEPPARFVMAWQIDAQWQYQPDVEKSSEVEVRFTLEPNGLTRVDLEHRNFARLGSGFEFMRNAVDSAGGWGDTLDLYAARVEKAASS